MGKGKKQLQKSVLDHVEELPKVRAARACLDKIQDLILNRHSSLEILDELEQLRIQVSHLQTKVWENHLRGCFAQAVSSEDIDTIETTVERLSRHLREI